LLPLATLGSALYLSPLPAALAALPQQSPIEITSQNTQFQALPPLQFNLSSDTELRVINNGSPDVFATAARAIVPDGAGSVTLDGDTYKLAQFHFHTPAENLVEGPNGTITYPMEMHLVFTDASNHILVVGRWVDAANASHPAQTSLDPIFSDLPQNESQTHVFSHFDLNTLLPSNLESFRYDGSLTTPNFDEGVKWVDLAQPLYMSQANINAYSSLFPNGDAREIQDLNGRIVLTDVPGFASAVPEPETYAMLLAGLGLITFVAGRRSKRAGSFGSMGSAA
jgi:carbonic anhydrase